MSVRPSSLNDRIPSDALALEGHVTHGEHLVDDEDVGIEVTATREGAGRTSPTSTA